MLPSAVFAGVVGQETQDHQPRWDSRPTGVRCQPSTPDRHGLRLRRLRFAVGKLLLFTAVNFFALNSVAYRQLDRISGTVLRSIWPSFADTPAHSLTWTARSLRGHSGGQVPPGMSRIPEGSALCLSDALPWQSPQPRGSGGSSQGGAGEKKPRPCVSVPSGCHQSGAQPTSLC